MNLQGKTVCLSTLLHGVLMLCALTVFSRQTIPPPPVAMRLSLVQPAPTPVVAPPLPSIAATTADREKPREPARKKNAKVTATKQATKTTAVKPAAATPQLMAQAVPSAAAHLARVATVAKEQAPLPETDTPAASPPAEATPPKPAAGGIGGGPLPADQLDAPLTVVQQTQPAYPSRARRQNIEGWVKVRLVVGEDGAVEEASVLDSQPKKTFDEAVLVAVRGWRFKAGTAGGVPVRSRVETVVRFRLD